MSSTNLVRSSHLALLLLLMVLSACRPAAALMTNTPTLTMSIGGILYVSLPVVNGGGETLSAMTVTDMRLGAKSRLAPAALPLSEGDLIPGATAAVSAGFDASAIAAGSRLLLTVRGTYRNNFGTFGFSLNRFLTVPARPMLTLFNNPGDPLLLRAVTAQGATIEYYGTKDAEGVPTSLTSVLVTSPSGATTTILLDASGRPAQMFAPNGSTFQITYLSPTLLSVSALSPDGSLHVNAGVDLSGVPGTGGDLMVQPAAAKASRSRAGIPCRLIVTPEPLAQPMQIPAVASAASYSYSDSVVTVRRKGVPVNGAHVYMDVGSATGYTFVLPGLPIGNGQYAVTIPHSVAPLPQPFHDIFQGTADVLAAGCVGVDALGPTGPLFVCVRLGGVASKAGGEAAAGVLTGCEAVFGAADLYCKTVDYSAQPGLPSFADGISKYLDGIVDRYAPSNYTLTAVASIPGTTLEGNATQSAPDGGPFPSFAFDFGGQISIDSLTLSPLNPAPYQPYTATAIVSGAAPNTAVTMSIVGTDGYQDSKSFTISGSAQCALQVPGTYAGDADLVTVTVAGGPTTTEVSIFGG